MSPGRFRVLGPVEVDGPGSAARIPPGRQQMILGLLLVEANRMVSTETLVDALWEENPPDTARTQVQICVSRLRRTLAGAGMSAVIDTRPPGYELRLNGDTLDLADFLARTTEARGLVKEGRTAEAAALLREASAVRPSLTSTRASVVRARKSARSRVSPLSRSS